MSGWFFYALGAAIFYGLHQIFTKMAADRISDGLGRFVVEGPAGGSTAPGQVSAEDEKVILSRIQVSF